jgi:hypothetical protein
MARGEEGTGGRGNRLKGKSEQEEGTEQASGKDLIAEENRIGEERER